MNTERGFVTQFLFQVRFKPSVWEGNGGHIPASQVYRQKRILEIVYESYYYNERKISKNGR